MLKTILYLLKVKVLYPGVIILHLCFNNLASLQAISLLNLTSHLSYNITYFNHFCNILDVLNILLKQ